MNLWAIFLTGLVTGGLTCVAVQGGLLAASLAQREEDKLKEKVKSGGNVFPILSFLTAKLVAYTLLGFLLGTFGSVFQLSLTAKVIMQFFVVIFMLGTAGNLLNLHPIFHYFVIQPPRFLTRLIRNQTKSKDFFAPALLGAFTIFIPCGTTQAMMVLAIGSGHPVFGAAIMAAFILGTSPVFFILGYLATRLGEALQKQFYRLAAALLILLAIFSLDNVLALSGAPTLSGLGKNIFCTVTFCSDDSVQTDSQATSEAAINFTNYGYTPNDILLKAGSEITLHLKNQSGSGCIQAFNIPSLGIQKIVPVGQSSDVKFQSPKSGSEIAFMCSMGMYRGRLKFI